MIASYDKIHMFDIDLPGGESYRESANYQPGETAVIADLPWGRIGLTICYDVRFPALYRALAESGASFLTVPSAFTRKTGEAHWHTLLRARAIENGCFVFAAAQAGLHENKRETYGHSLIVDPWGDSRRRRRRARRFPGEDRSGEGRDRAQDRAVAAAWPALQRRRPQGGPGASAPGAGIGMIRYNLRCERGHAFESWFQSSSAYETQEKRKLVNCPVCGSAKVERAIMAPQIVSKKGRDRASTGARAARHGSRRARVDAADDGAGARAARQAQGIARSHRQERRQCRRAFSERSPQDALRRYRASSDLWRGLAG